MATQITPLELKAKLAEAAKPALLDVREAHELEICQIPGNIHIPLGELPERLAELASLKDKELVVYCRSGRRSDAAASFLIEHGFTNVLNLDGGILAWSDQVEPAMAKY